MDFLRIEGVSKKVVGGIALQKTSLRIEQFQKIALVGETGSGKSTLLKIIGGFMSPDTGMAYFQGKKVWGPNEQLIPGHPGIAYLSQHFELRNNYFVHEILEYATKISEEEAKKIFAICQIDYLLQRKTDQLSGGERQRISLARLLVGAPKLLLLDEPFSNLDMTHKSIIKKVIHDICDELKITCMLVSHDPVDVLSWADEIFVLHEGKIIQKGDAVEIYNHPKNEYVAGLFGAYNIIKSGSIAIKKAWKLMKEKNPIIIRPENILLTKNKKSAISGIIKKNSFCGHYSSIEVKTEEQDLLMYTKNSLLNVGDEIFLTQVDLC
jgi:ABC-type sulfate/molybdate transport systems ATPase subunit